MSVDLISCIFGCPHKTAAEALPLSQSLFVFFFLGSLRSDHGCNIWCSNLANRCFHLFHQTLYFRPTNHATSWTTLCTQEPKTIDSDKYNHDTETNLTNREAKAEWYSSCLVHWYTNWSMVQWYSGPLQMSDCCRPNCLNVALFHQLFSCDQEIPCRCLENPDWFWWHWRCLFIDGMGQGLQKLKQNHTALFTLGFNSRCKFFVVWWLPSFPQDSGPSLL